MYTCDIANYLNVPVVAEGLETEEQYLTLKAMGCDLVQSYYFSKPVPPVAFDHFLIERAVAKVELTQEVKKTYMSISKSLTSDFENIYYVDLVTNYYLEFYAGKDGDLQIRPGGIDFLADALFAANHKDARERRPPHRHRRETGMMRTMTSI